MRLASLSVLLLLLAALAPAHAQSRLTQKHILAAPPLRWDNLMTTGRPTLGQTAYDLTRLTGGLAFGMTPVAVNEALPVPIEGIEWAALASAAEFTGDVRYFWARLDKLPILRGRSDSCVGADSYVVFLFRAEGLFRISYRLIPDLGCTDQTDSTQFLFQRFVGLATDVAVSVHYKVREADVIDVTDPALSYMVPIRWEPSGG